MTLWINTSNSFLNISGLLISGLYHGFLTALPIGLSQILSIRAFLLLGNVGGTIAVSGSIIGQAITKLSVYYWPLYVILVKPHVVTLLVLPYMLLYWFRTKDFLDNQLLHPIKSLHDVRVRQIFMDSLIFSLFNPIVLPSPLFTRSLNLFIFRYSNDFSFAVSSFCGWLGGYILFTNLSKLFLVRIERDLSLNYLSIKSIINEIFSIIILTLCLLYLGRAPVPLSTKKMPEIMELKQETLVKLPWFTKPWPTILFDYRRWNRPFRYIGNGENKKSTVKKQVSQYFFDTCSSDGKQRISFTSLPSYSIFKRDLKEYLNIPDISSSSEDIYKEWISTKKQRKSNLDNELTNRIQALDNNFSVLNVTEKLNKLSNDDEQETINKLSNDEQEVINQLSNDDEQEVINKLSNDEQEVLIEIYDPFLNRNFKGRYIIDLRNNRKSILGRHIFPHSILYKHENFVDYLKQQEFVVNNNKLKDWIYIQRQILERQKMPLPWEPLDPDAYEAFESVTTEGAYFLEPTENNLENNLQNVDEQGIGDDEKSAYYVYRKKAENLIIEWKDIFNLPYHTKKFFFKSLENIKWIKLLNSWKDLFSNNSLKVKDILFLITRTLQIQNDFGVQRLEKNLPRWTSKLVNLKFDVIGITYNDARYRKLRNFDFIFNTERSGPERTLVYRIVRRFSQQSDFRRNLIIGSMRARRRKTLVWNFLQLKAHSPFFLRVMDEPTSLQSYLEVPDGVGVESTSAPSTKTDQKLILFYSDSNKKGKVTEAERLAIANRWDFASAHWGRGCLLIIQSYVRRYIVIPLLIISKNIIRILLFQIPEWKEDWNQWDNEIYVNCNYEGTQISVDKLPSLWQKEGLQIKILYPFYLKPWHNSRLVQLGIVNNNDTDTTKISDNTDEIEKTILSDDPDTKFSYNTDEIEKTIFDDETKNSSIFLSKKRKFNYSYLTVWGSQTDSPFGNKKKHPSFWKPVIKELRKKRKIISSKITQNLQHFKFIPLREGGYDESDTPTVLKNRLDNFINNDNFESEPNNEYKNKINLKENKEIIYESPIGITSESYDKSSSQSSNQIEYGTGIIIQNSEHLKSNGIGQIFEQTYYGIETNTVSKEVSEKYPNDRKKLKLIKILIKFYQKFVELRRNNIQLIQERIQPISIYFKEINRNIDKNIFYLIRFNIQLIIKLTKNILMICNEVIYFDNNTFQSETKNNKSVDQNLIVPGERARNPNNNMILVHQADVFHEIRQVKTINKSYLKNLLKYWKLDSFIKEDFKVVSDEKGVLSDSKEPQNLSEEERSVWLQSLHGFNLPSHIWCKIAPRTWRNEVTKYWEMEKKFPDQFDGDISYTFTKDPSWERTKKLSKRHKSNLLSYSYLDFTKDSEINNFTIWQSKDKQIIYNNRIQEIRKSQLVNDEEISKNLTRFDFQEFDNKKNLYFEFKMNLWFSPEFPETESSGFKLVPKKSSLIKEKHYMTEYIGIRERECYTSIYKWKQASKELEKVLKKLKDIILLTILTGDQEEAENQEDDSFLSLPPNLIENIKAFVSSIRKEKIKERFEHLEFRLPRLLDDEFLIYKTISTLINFKNRLKRNLNLDIFYESIPRVEIIENKGQTIPSYLNIEDVLLSKRRIELRVLNSPEIKNQDAILDGNTFGRNGHSYDQLVGNNKDYPNKNQIIKRFLWPSYRLEDLACMNRFWFNTNNGSRFAMLRIRMYPSTQYSKK